MELTLQEVREKEIALKQVTEELEEALQQQQEAKALGDFSENEELASATKKVRELNNRKAELADQLSDYTLIKPNKSARIGIGDTVSIFKVDGNNNMISEPRLMRIASEGDPIIKMTLGIESPLGKAILNGTDGIYTVTTLGGAIRYDVKKVYKTC